jgi:hypothetical protein
VNDRSYKSAEMGKSLRTFGYFMPIGTADRLKRLVEASVAAKKT